MKLRERLRRSATDSAGGSDVFVDVRSPEGGERLVEAPLSSGTARTVILVLLFVVLVLTLALPGREFFRQRAQAKELRSAITVTEQRVASLQSQINEWQSTDHVEAEARRRLHFVKPGEVGYVVLSPDRQTVTGDMTRDLPVSAPKAWYGHLWSTVEGTEVASDKRIPIRPDAPR